MRLLLPWSSNYVLFFVYAVLFLVLEIDKSYLERSNTDRGLLFLIKEHVIWFTRSHGLIDLKNARTSHLWHFIRQTSIRQIIAFSARCSKHVTIIKTESTSLNTIVIYRCLTELWWSSSRMIDATCCIRQYQNRIIVDIACAEKNVTWLIRFSVYRRACICYYNGKARNGSKIKLSSRNPITEI